MSRMEVRCCCDAKLLGTVEVAHVDAAGQFKLMTVFLVPEPTHSDPHPAGIRFEVAEVFEQTMTSPELEADCLAFRQAMEGRRRWLALKKPHEVPMRIMRRIRGFTEAGK